MTILTNRVAFFTLIMILQQLRCEGVKESISTSIFAMKALLETERQLLAAMEDYTNQLESKLNIIRGALNEMRAENHKSEINPEQYLSNPINSYALIRRLHEDWVNWMIFFRRRVGEDIKNRIQTLRSDIPKDSDLIEATNAIYRISAVYNIRPVDMAAGLFKSKQYDARFTSIDCFSLGYQMFKNGLYKNAENWLNVSLQLYQDSDVNAVLDFNKIKILELHAQVLLKQNRSIAALDAINNALHLSPHKAKLLRTKAQIEFMILTSNGVETKNNETVKHQSEDKITRAQRFTCKDYAYRSQFHCLYNKTTSAFLQLAPLKMEILQLDPYIVLYHDVLSDAEISEMKGIAANDLERAGVIYSSNNESIDNERTVHGYWFENESISIINRIDQRITDMTGFDLWDSEFIQILNYGIGGHFDTHVDWYGSGPEFINSSFNTNEGDRIATVIFYMSDVEQGGATAFPEIQLSVYPKKGTALMWHNLDPRGEGYESTLHCACPVIVGSKWVLTKWIGQYSQMFRRPCVA